MFIKKQNKNILNNNNNNNYNNNNNINIVLIKTQTRCINMCLNFNFYVNSKTWKENL